VIEMRILVTWGSKRSGTAGIGEIVAETLRASGHDVVAAPADAAPAPLDVDAVIVGGALYANRWHRDARRYVDRHARAQRRVPVCRFSSGPLDDSAEHADLPPPRQVRALAERIGAQGHVTFGGRLEATAHGFAAAAMARDHVGDWRAPDHIRAWAGEVARALPAARPRPAIDPQGRSLARLVAYGMAGWAVSAATFTLESATLATVLHAIAAPLCFAGLALLYQRAAGARPPLAMALAWTAILGLLDLAARGAPALGSFAGFWLPLALALLAAWAAGSIAAMLPLPAAPMASSRAGS
jgi:menaquinone-dependent protoporphyrinogen oxidase